MRKSRRKIKRGKRGKSKPRKYKSRLERHLNRPITTKWTKLTTYVLIVFEFVFVMWWLQDLLLNFNEIVMKLKALIRIGG